MIAKQRAVHQRVWGAIGLVLLVGVVLSVLVRRREAENAGSLPGVAATKLETGTDAKAK